MGTEYVRKEIKGLKVIFSKGISLVCIYSSIPRDRFTLLCNVVCVLHCTSKIEISDIRDGGL